MIGDGLGNLGNLIYKLLCHLVSIMFIVECLEIPGPPTPTNTIQYAKLYIHKATQLHTQIAVA
jgi:hypothetical protein